MGKVTFKMLSCFPTRTKLTLSLKMQKVKEVFLGLNTYCSFVILVSTILNTFFLDQLVHFENNLEL